MPHDSRELPEVWTSAQWVDYFGANAARPLSVPWEAGVGATPEELCRITDSLRGWQLGETSDGRHLLAAAANYAAKLGDPGFLDAIRLFIAEEQRHGEALGRFLDLAGTPRATWDWGDSLFRAFRYVLPRMEIWATVVVMVETHAMIYYAASDARRDRRSPSNLPTILADEVPRIGSSASDLRSSTIAAGLRHALDGSSPRAVCGITLAIWMAMHGRRFARAGSRSAGSGGRRGQRWGTRGG